MSEPDWACIARYRKGDVGAMDDLVETYRRPLYAFIRNKTRQQEEADDVFQETWFRALSKLDGYRPDNFFGWLVRIARNLMIDRARRRKPESSLDEERDDGRPVHALTDNHDPGPRGHLERNDFSAALQAAAARLPDDQREVFMLRVQGDVSFKAIARIQGVSINTALARMQYALDKLRRELAEYEDGAGML